MERLFISLSHLQHSDTAAVKDSLPQTAAQGETTFKSKAQPNHSPSLHVCMYLYVCMQSEDAV